MQYPWLSALSFLAAVALSAFATPIARWDDILVKHSWSDVPADWVTLGYPSAGTTLDLHIALKPEKEGALIDALYEVSDPEHPRCVFFTTGAPPLAPLFTCTAGLFQIWPTPFQ